MSGLLTAPGHCPFCGDSLIHVHGIVSTIYEVVCRVCHRTAIILTDQQRRERGGV